MDLVSLHHPGGGRRGFCLFQNVQLVLTHNWSDNVEQGTERNIRM